MNIAIIGTGYVGLVTGTCFADKGNKVICVDIDQNKIATLKKGKNPIYEPGLDELLQKNIANGNLTFTTHLKEATDVCDVILLALPTPPNEDGSADLSHVLKVASQLGEMIDSYKVIVNKSTVPVGTGDKVYNFIASKAKHDFDVVSNPEFLREGMAVEEFMNPDRVVIGTSSQKAYDVMKSIYLDFVNGNENLIIQMDIRSAEMTKYAANAFLAARLSFINEIANLCEITGANIENVKNGMGHDKRIGMHFLNAGIGYGGSCFPKDVKALINTANENSYDFKILKTVDEVNNRQRLKLYDKVKRYFKNLHGKKLAVWGLAFKPETDDVREAPAKYNLKKLVIEGAQISAYDPQAMHNFQLYGIENITYLDNALDCLKDADALLIMTEWSEFKKVDLKQVASLLKDKVVFDGRNLYSPKEMAELGFYYECIGMPLHKNESLKKKLS